MTLDAHHFPRLRGLISTITELQENSRPLSVTRYSLAVEERYRVDADAVNPDVSAARPVVLCHARS
jgi:hypothetical protein